MVLDPGHAFQVVKFQGGKKRRGGVMGKMSSGLEDMSLDRAAPHVHRAPVPLSVRGSLG